MRDKLGIVESQVKWKHTYGMEDQGSGNSVGYGILETVHVKGGGNGIIEIVSQFCVWAMGGSGVVDGRDTGECDRM